MEKEARDKFKVFFFFIEFLKNLLQHLYLYFQINARQCRFIYEILRLQNTNIHDEREYEAYRLDIKKRLNLTYHKQRTEIKKLEKSGIDPQWIHASLPTVEERIEQLKAEYKVGIRHFLKNPFKI